ncbi:hypothetical protein A2U01_0081492, partial [Trifolium medium]|nr:hypothetical protein [Trifolium medium]
TGVQWSVAVATAMAVAVVWPDSVCGCGTDFETTATKSSPFLLPSLFCYILFL